MSSYANAFAPIACLESRDQAHRHAYFKNTVAATQGPHKHPRNFSAYKLKKYRVSLKVKTGGAPGRSDSKSCKAAKQRGKQVSRNNHIPRQKSAGHHAPQPEKRVIEMPTAAAALSGN
jgi:hypothetical protein